MRSLEEKAFRLLGGVVEEDTLRLYLRLLAAGECPSEEAAGLLGGAQKVDILVRAGMAQMSEPAAGHSSRLSPAPMDVVMQRTLVDLARDALHDYEQLLDGYRRMCDLAASTGATADPSVGQLAQIITDSDQVIRLTSTLMESVQREWVTLSSHAPTEPVQGVEAESIPPPVGRGARCRAIYDVGCLHETATRDKLEAIARTGIQVRILPRVRMSLRIADEGAALLSLTSAETASALLVQSPVIVGALREYFGLLWQQAIPFGATGRNDHGFPDNQIKILRLLVQGMSDDVIAERVSMSLATVRRHVRAIREELRTETRFQLGVVAVKKGLVD